jgi:hypothetical protein
MAAPRLRQLRRDNTLFRLAMNTVRLHLEENDRLAQQPELHNAPDADLAFIQQSIAQWVGLASNYIIHKFRCPTQQAMQSLGELLLDLKAAIPVGELRQVPYQQALFLPSAWASGQQPAEAVENAPLNEQAPAG